MKVKMAALAAALLAGVLAVGCCGPCQAIGSLGTRDLHAQATPTTDAQPVWFDVWAEGTTVHRSAGAARVHYTALTWHFVGTWGRLERRADREIDYDFRWLDAGTYTVWLEAWYGTSYHRVSDRITVEVQP